VVKDGGWKFKSGGSGTPDSAASSRFAAAFADLHAMGFANPALADTAATRLSPGAVFA
jgi:hypothetical protein